MAISKGILWGGLGWVLGGPIGALVGFALATMSEERKGRGFSNIHLGWGDTGTYPRTKAGDFAVSLLVLFGSVMTADKKTLKSELEYVRQFLVNNFGRDNAKDLMILFRDVLKQDYSIATVCRQIKKHMDHPGRLEMIHVLFGLSRADGEVHPSEVSVIQTIARYLGVSEADFESIRAMFVSDSTAAYRILEIEPNTPTEQIKRSYRKMASKYHPDKVQHLGADIQKLAEEKFKAINDAYQKIKKQRQFT